MKNPKDFPKGERVVDFLLFIFVDRKVALWAATICEVIFYTICGAVVYHFVGNQYMTSPAFGSLQPTFKR